MAQSADAIEQTSYLRITSEAEVKENITGDGDYEISFGMAAVLALTPEAADKLYRMLAVRVPELRRTARHNGHQ